MKTFLILILSLPAIANARLIDKCGTYYAEGYYTEIESNLHNGQKKRVILLERGSNSEIKFYISNSNISKSIPDTHLGVNFKLKLLFTSSCWYACEGNVVEAIEPLDPYQSPRPFLFPRPHPIKGTEIECKPNTFEDGTREINSVTKSKKK